MPLYSWFIQIRIKQGQPLHLVGTSLKSLLLCNCFPSPPFSWLFIFQRHWVIVVESPLPTGPSRLCHVGLVVQHMPVSHLYFLSCGRYISRLDQTRVWIFARLNQHRSCVLLMHLKIASLSVILRLLSRKK